MSDIPAPGARIIVRDAQWLVRRIERTQGDGYVIHAVGLSELVRDKEAQFLNRADTRIEILDPAKTTLTRDESPNFRASLLFMESLLRKTVPPDHKIYSGHKAAMDSVPYQLDPTALALKQPRQRLLIADAVGLGKTLECGILLSELIRRGRARRILVVTVKSMLTQFQKELWSRFSIPLTRLDSVGLNRVRSRIPVNHNPFHYFDRSIISVDTLKQDTEYRVHLESAWWDVIVIDEAHNVAERGKARSLRARLAKLLASRSDSLIMLSATPHDGSAQSFASLMNMLDPTAIADESSYTPDDIRGLFIRRFKKDIKHQVNSEFKERVISCIKGAATEVEEAAFTALTEAQFARLDSRRTGAQLFRTVLEKALFSSPAACLKTIDNRIRTLEKSPGPDAAADIKTLGAIRSAVAAITPARFSKFHRLVELLRDDADNFHFTGKDKTDRLVIFTERIETLEFLKTHLPNVLGLKPGQVATLRGSDGDRRQQEVVEAFGQETSPIRLLIATDVASEGINLHYLCHKMIHFDVPWSLMVFQQRNGRIDRYGQPRIPYIGYLMTDTACPRIKGDLRILELLIKKDGEAMANIGDPSAFLGVYDIEAEERITARAMESGTTPESFEAEMDATAGADLFDLLDAALAASNTGDDTAPETAAMPSLFPSDFEFARQGLQHIGFDARVNREEQTIELPITRELGYRFRNFPREIMRGRDSFTLCADPEVIRTEIDRSRKEETAWPTIQYLWELDPVIHWLTDKVTANFRRHEAPILCLPDLHRDESIFLLTGLLPNRKGHVIIQDWFGCRVVGGRFQGVLSLEELMKRTGLGVRSIANRNSEVAMEPLQKLLPDVVLKGEAYMHERREEFRGKYGPMLKEQLERLAALHEGHLRQLELKLGEGSNGRLEEKRRATDGVFAEYKEWIRDTMETEDSPYLKVVAVMSGGGEKG